MHIFLYTTWFSSSKAIPKCYFICLSKFPSFFPSIALNALYTFILSKYLFELSIVRSLRKFQIKIPWVSSLWAQSNIEKRRGEKTPMFSKKKFSLSFPSS